MCVCLSVSNVGYIRMRVFYYSNKVKFKFLKMFISDVYTGIGFTPGAIEASKERLRSRIIRGVPLDIPYEPDDDPHAMQTRLSTKLPLHTRFGRLR